MMRRIFILFWIFFAGACHENKPDHPDDVSNKALKIMTFNIRNSDDNDKENTWNEGRKERVIDLFKKYRPSIIGVQEAKRGKYGDQIADLQALPGYKWYGVGRDDGKDQGEFEGILYLKDRFSKIKAGQFWFSSSPEVPGTTFSLPNMQPSSDANIPRMATWIILYDKFNNINLFVINQHWPLTTTTQKQSALLLRSMIETLNQDIQKVPVIALGDFNMTDEYKNNPNSLNPHGAYSIILKGEPINSTWQLYDAYRSLHPLSKGEITFHNYHGGSSYFDKNAPPYVPQNNRMDFIFASPQLKPINAEIIRDSFSDNPAQWPSDHYPVFATFVLKE